jgi:hypothetical protein
MDSRFKSLRTLRTSKPVPAEILARLSLNKENLIPRCLSNDTKKITIDMRTGSPDLPPIHSRILKTKKMRLRLGIKILKSVPIELPFTDSNFTKTLESKESDLFKFYS